MVKPNSEEALDAIKLTKRQQDSLQKVLDVIERNQDSGTNLKKLESYLEDTGFYQSMIEEGERAKKDPMARIDNVKILLDIASKFPSLDDFYN